jgi:hypothetical protein
MGGFFMPQVIRIADRQGRNTSLLMALLATQPKRPVT